MNKNCITFESIINFLTSLIISVTFTTLLANSFLRAESYPEFIVGDMAWEGQSKLQDFLAPFLFVLTFCLIFQTIKNSLEKLRHKFGEEKIDDLVAHLSYWLIPGIIYCGSNLIKPINNFYIFQVSAAILLAWTFILRYHAAQKKLPNHNFISGLFFLILCFVMAPMSISLALNTIKPAIILTKNLFISFAIIAFVTGFFLLRFKNQVFPKIFCLFQVPLVLFFFILIPQKYTDAAGIVFGYEVSIYLKLFTAALIFLALFDIYKRYRLPLQTDLQKLISPLALCAFILALKYGTPKPPAISYDDYHFGENLLAFWSIIKFHMIPYVDYAHTHGFFHNDLPGIIAEIFYGGK